MSSLFSCSGTFTEARKLRSLKPGSDYESKVVMITTTMTIPGSDGEPGIVAVPETEPLPEPFPQPPPLPQWVLNPLKPKPKSSLESECQ